MSLYSLDPIKFQEADEQLAKTQHNQEWPLLHGDPGPPRPSAVPDRDEAARTDPSPNCGSVSLTPLL